jgi:hypothetical protein
VCLTCKWYYFAATWNFSGANTTAYGINYYLGPAGSNTASLASGFLQRGGTGNISSGAGLGGAGTVTVSGNLGQSADGFEDSPAPGFAEALASFSNQLTVAQLDSQYEALIVVPEPSTLALCLLAVVGLCLAVARRRPSLQK